MRTRADYLWPLQGLSSKHDYVRSHGSIDAVFHHFLTLMPSPLGDKMRAVRKQKKLSLDQLAELTDSSKSYLWDLENKDDPKPSFEKIAKIAAALEVTPDFLVTEDTAPPDQEVLDQAFFRKYRQLPESTKKKLRQVLDAWESDP